jgi:hypothetical protein
VRQFELGRHNSFPIWGHSPYREVSVLVIPIWGKTETPAYSLIKKHTPTGTDPPEETPGTTREKAGTPPEFSL